MKKHFLSTALLLLVSGSLYAGIESGSVYKISTLQSGNRTLLVENSSLNTDAKIVAWTETGANSQRWRVTADETGNYYYLTNVYSGKVIRMSGTAAKGIGVTQTPQSTSSNQKWDITAVETAGENCYYITNANLLSGSEKLYLEMVNGDKLNADGSPLQLWTKDEEGLARRIWKFEKITEQPNALTVAVRDDMGYSWRTKYYKQETNGYTIGGGFWGGAENMEILLDAYETTGKIEYKTMFEESYKTFIKQNSTSWRGNDFNDDIAWACLASIRAYLMFGNATGVNYLNNAKTNYDMMYARALIKKNNYYLLRWKEGNADGTGSCINGPAEVCACYLAIATGDNIYYEKAKMLYANQRLHLYNPEDGHVYDSTSDGGSTNTWASTYNQGTYLGAAVMLYNYYKDELYKNDAKKIIQYTRQHLCDGNGVINVCGGGADLPGFKGILMRYVRRFIVDLNQPEYVDWMQTNAIHAYNNRNSAGIIWTAWWEKSTEDYKHGTDNYDSFGCGTAVSAAYNAPLDKNTIVKKAFSKIEAGSFNYIRGAISENNVSGEVLEMTQMKDGDYLGYNNVDFKTNQATGVALSVANSAGERQIEIRLNSSTGTLLGTAVIPASNGSWTTVNATIAPVDGMKNIYLVFKGADNGLKFNSFRFTADYFIYPDITIDRDKITASHPEISPEKNITNGIDDQLNTVLAIACGNSGEAWLQYHSSSPVSLKGYALASGNAGDISDPKDWKLQVSNNGTDWTDLDTQSNQSFTERYQLKKYNVTTSNTYTYFRLSVTQRKGNADDLQLSEWQLYGSTSSNESITNDGGTPSNQPDNWLQYKATAKYKLTSYSLTSAANATEDPKNWTLYGSNDGNDWVEIDDQYNQTFGYRSATQIYPCNPATGYVYFKLHITDNNGGTHTQ
ncbi:MAG: carbohydrate-binding protein, partial [Candidatus Symbiothrix sp.]|nr:carbohydrate-binding protein [Candidatus Symbiothrix sp.]